MPRTPIDHDEELQLGEARRFGVSGEAPDAVYTDLARAAAWACRTPVALLAVPERGGARLLAGRGIPVGELPGPPPLLAAAFAADHLLEIPDTEREERWRDANRLGAIGPLRFFAAVPLAPGGGPTLGALAVASPEPRQLDGEQREALGIISRQIASQWELRHRIAGLSAEQRELYRQLASFRKLKAGLRVLQPAIEQSADAILILLPDLEPSGPTILYANPAAARLLGYADEELDGRSVRQIYGPGSDPATIERMVGELAAGRVFRGTLVSYRKDGSEVLLERQVSPVRNGGRQISHYVSILREVGRPPAAASQPMPHLLGDLPDLCFRVGHDGTILDYQAADQHLLYQPPERFLGRRMQDVLPESVAALLDHAFGEALREQRAVTLGYELPLEGGRQGFEARLLPLLGDELLLLVRQLPGNATTPSGTG